MLRRKGKRTTSCSKEETRKDDAQHVAAFGDGWPQKVGDLVRGTGDLPSRTAAPWFSRRPGYQALVKGQTVKAVPGHLPKQPAPCSPFHLVDGTETDNFLPAHHHLASTATLSSTLPLLHLLPSTSLSHPLHLRPFHPYFPSCSSQSAASAIHRHHDGRASEGQEGPLGAVRHPSPSAHPTCC